MAKPIAPETLREKLYREGKTLADYCRERNVNYRDAVLVMNGYSKGRTGKSHRAAVGLGLKAAA